jgi:hypothetical protein
MSKSTINPSLKALFDYIWSVGITKTVKCKSGKGFMIYQVQKIDDIQRLTELAEAINTSWTVIKSDSYYDKTGVKHAARIYVGYADNDGDMKSLDSFAELDIS